MHLPVAALAQRGRGPSAGLSHQESCESQTCQEAREEAGEKGVFDPTMSSAASPHTHTTPETETLLQKSVSAPKEEAKPRHHKAKQRHRERVRHSERGGENGAKDVGGALRQCLGPGCVQPARVDSKYCSEDCGMKLAAK